MSGTVSLPTGEVTFLFTDIEGSTRRWEADPDQMRATLEVHAAICRAAVDRHGGWLVKDTGDGYLAAFADPRDALDAAVAVQRGLCDATWPGEPVVVRAAIHTGHATPRDGDYHDPAVNRCARVMGAAHGGQVLVSADTAAALRGSPLGDIDLVDLGPHRLKDLDRATHLFQVTHPGLPDRFPPLRSLARTPNNLPHVATPLLGRDDDVDDILGWLDGERLVTLTGAGGIGKTRLALQVAAEGLDSHADGAWLVELGSVSDASLVASVTAASLRVPDTPGREPADALVAHLSDREILVLLDNCEHVIDAVAGLADTLLAGCPRLKILATSREPLGLVGERVRTVAALPTDTSASPAVELFLQRSRAAGAPPPSSDELPTIATICRRLDGLPLAIELAAARSRILSPTEISARLDERFSLLTGGSRTALPRQRTLEATVAWSYDLLNEPARILLRRLSVFASPFGLDDAEAVCATSPLDPSHVLELVAELADRSLLAVEVERASRYRLLETIRAYARERLVESDDDLDALRSRHLQWAAEQAREAGAHLDGAEQATWLATVEGQLDDHRAAMRWAADNDRPVLGATIAASLYRYWYLRGVREGQEWLDLFAGESVLPPELRARVMFTHGSLLQSMGHYERSIDSLERSVELYAELDQPRGLGYALHYLMRSSWGLRPRDEVRAMTDRALEVFRELEDPVGIGLSLLFVAVDEYERGRIDTGLEVMRECDAVMRSVGAPHLIAHGVEISGWGLAVAGRTAEAARLFAEAIPLYRQVGSRQCIAHCLENVAYLVCDVDPTSAAVLLGATERLRDVMGVPVPPYENLSFVPARSTVRERLSAAALDAAWREGSTLDLDGAMQRALSAADSLV